MIELQSYLCNRQQVLRYIKKMVRLKKRNRAALLRKIINVFGCIDFCGNLSCGIPDRDNHTPWPAQGFLMASL